MRIWAAVLAACVLTAAPARAENFECVWRAMTMEHRAIFTNGIRSGSDVVALSQSGRISEDMLLAPMTGCGVAESQAEMLGQYLAARGLAQSLRAILITEHGLHEDQLAGLTAGITAADRHAFAEAVSTGGQPSEELVMRVRESVAALGPQPDNSALFRAAGEYVFAHSLVEELAR